VILRYPYSDADLLHLMAHDDDAFNRWEAAQRLAAAIILEQRGSPSPAFLAAARNVLADPEPAFAAEVLTLPSGTFLPEQMEVVEPDRLHASRNGLRRALANSLRSEFFSCYERLKERKPYSPDAASAGRRALKNLCLNYLGERGESALAYAQFEAADNMTD